MKAKTRNLLEEMPQQRKEETKKKLTYMALLAREINVKKKEIKHLQSEIDKLQKELDNV